MRRDEMRRTVALSLLSSVVGGALSAWLLVGAPVVAEESPGQGTKIVSAEEFRLMDKQGRIRALLSFSADGGPYLALIDQQETHRVWIGLTPLETGVAVRDVDGATRLVLSVDPEGEPSLVVRDRQRRSKSFHT
jgi:hypothetical protein